MLTCLTLCLATLTPSSFAFSDLNTEKQYEQDIDIERYLKTDSVSSSLTIDSRGKATCYGDATASSSNYRVQIAMTLYNEAGNIMSWTSSGGDSISLSKTWYVSSGHTYHVLVTSTVYSSNGSLLETVTAASRYITF